MSLFICLLAALKALSPAYAQDTSAAPKAQFVSSVMYALNSESGPLPPMITHGVGIVFPFQHGWSGYVEGSATTSFVALQPGFVMLIGSTKKLSSDLVIGVSGFYKVVPAYTAESSVTHVIGWTVAPILPQEFGSISFPVGAAATMNTPGITGTIAFKIAIK